MTRVPRSVCTREESVHSNTPTCARPSKAVPKGHPQHPHADIFRESAQIIQRFRKRFSQQLVRRLAKGPEVTGIKHDHNVIETAIKNEENSNNIN